MSSELISGDRGIIVGMIGLLILVIIFWFINQPYITGIILIIGGTILFVRILSDDAARNAKPLLFASLSPDLEEIILENEGTAEAKDIRVRIAGTNEPWEIGTLAPDTSFHIRLPSMKESLTAVVTYRNAKDQEKKKVFKLGEVYQEKDPFKPTFPLFGWKEKD